ncbi:carbon starvation CstA family protein [Adlercreutzia equolifaciens]|uniref:carbon starvation CstA family protein n=1 Tax=Adlercreutzia equolifaciens TaxID=446660 RepID=UPI0023B09B0D|nr:carbon starvation CstA family protein [Adlercreutzia equolifaciens]MDE8702380.1 carbon starvation CstA family protein [Adlercreutzia equolifaciens]
MNALIVLLIAIVVLVCGYVFYGGWLAKQWGIEPNRPTPAHELEDGVDYVPAAPYVVLGHHFSSIAGAGPINGPIQAAIFGWVPVLLWVLIGGIFFGAMHDFGALFASIRHKGQTLATVIEHNIDDTAKKLFCIFAYLTLILVVAAFASIVASTFAVVPVTAENAATAEVGNLANMRTAMISVLFILVAVIYGFATRGRKIPTAANIISAIIIIVAVVAVGYNLPLIALDNTAWMVLVGLYILVASVAPVWILLQPRDYLSSYLLYGMIALALIGIIGAGFTGDAVSLEIPAFTGFTAVAGESKVAASGFLFPALFITIACGAISGFHSLVASGTTSKQLDREAEAQPIAYGGMLLECLVAVISLCAVAFVFTGYMDGTYASPTQVFAAGLSQMLACVPGLAGAESVAYALLVLAVSVFCLTSLDTATRLARYMFQELFTPHGVEMNSLTGWRAVLTNPWVATIITVILGVGLGLTGYQLVWPLFGAANQLLAALGLLAVCAWLGNAGKNNKMFYFPMVFMMVVTLCSLAITVYTKFGLLAAGTVDAATVLQLIIALLLMVFAVILAVKGCKTIFGKKEQAQA